jgi:hypothetical protein
MRKALWLLVLALIVFPAQAMAAGSCVFSKIVDDAATLELSYVCTAHTDGTIASPTIAAADATTPRSGVIVKAFVIPGTSGDQPDDNFVVTLTSDKTSTKDLLEGEFGACDNATTTVKSMYDGYVYPLASEVITPGASGMGSANKMTLRLVIRKAR